MGKAGLEYGYKRIYMVSFFFLETREAYFQKYPHHIHVCHNKKGYLQDKTQDAVFSEEIYYILTTIVFLQVRPNISINDRNLH